MKSDAENIHLVPVCVSGSFVKSGPTRTRYERFTLARDSLQQKILRIKSF